MDEYYYLSSSYVDSSGSFVDEWFTSSLDEECSECGPITSSVEGEYILLDGYKGMLEDNLYRGTITLEEEKRLRTILFTQRYVEEDKEFIKYCFNSLLG